MQEHTFESQNVKTCKRGDKCVHPDGPTLPNTDEYFYRIPTGTLRGSCKECIKSERRQYHEKHREYENQRSREYIQRDKKKWYARNRAWAVANHDHLLEVNRQKYATNKNGHRDRKLQYLKENYERYLANNRRWTAEHPEQRRVITNRFRMKRHNTEGTFTAEELKLQYDSQRGRCWYCQCELGDTWHTDHRVPLSRGGSNCIENIVITCPTCNLRKGSKLPHEFNGRLL